MFSRKRHVYYTKYQTAPRPLISGVRVRALMPNELDWWARAIEARRERLPFEERLWEGPAHETG